MLKKILIVTGVLLITGVGSFYWVKETTTAKLIEPIRIDEHYDDFIIHIRVENDDNGLQVLRSLEYIGSEKISISHQTPLIGVSINYDNVDVTGSPVTKEMDPADIYYQEPEMIAFHERGTYTLYIDCKFLLNDEEPINIKIDRELIFH